MKSIQIDDQLCYKWFVCFKCKLENVIEMKTLPNCTVKCIIGKNGLKVLNVQMRRYMLVCI